MTDHRDHVMRLCRAVLPGVAGVVLANGEGRVLAHEARVSEPAGVARTALAQRREAQRIDPSAGASALVRVDAGLVLVVFVPPTLAEEWQVPDAAPLSAAV